MSVLSASSSQNSVPDFKLGLEYVHESARANLLMNLKSLKAESQLTYLLQSDLAVGANFQFDPAISSLTKYDFGFTWTPVHNALVGLKHESMRKELMEIGKIRLFIHNYATQRQTVGTEFSLDWQKRQLEARLGLLHRFDDNTHAKLKIDHHGYIDAIIKHKISQSLSVSVTAGLNVKSDVLESPRNRSLPFGIGLDLNL